jgi:hypothetical protein
MLSPTTNFQFRERHLRLNADSNDLRWPEADQQSGPEAGGQQKQFQQGKAKAGKIKNQKKIL